jgi:hypothetical protein
MKLEFSRQISENSSNTKFRKNPSSESRVVSRGRTDGLTNAIVETHIKTISRNIQHAVMFKNVSLLSHSHRQTVLQSEEKVDFVHDMKAYGEVEVWLHSF